MKAGLINDENMPLFEGFFSPWISEHRGNGEPMEFIGLTDEETAVGALAVSFLFGNPEIISIYVAPEYRNRGGGSLLLKTVEQIAKDEGLYLTAAFTIPGDEGRELARFFASHGYNRVAEWPKIFRFSLLELSETLRDLPYSSDMVEKIVSLSSLTNIQLRDYSTKAYQKGLPTPQGGFQSTNVDRDLSMISLKENDQVNGYIIIEKTGKASISVPAFYQKIVGGRTGIYLMEAAFQEAAKHFTPKTEILTYCISPSSVHLLKHFVPNAENESYLYQKLF